MNKSNKILVGVLTFIVVCLIGYALFSETITVTGTATAKGNFDLTFTCDSSEGFSQDFNIEASSSCSIDGQTITTTSFLPKPTENTSFLITIKNTGTIPAVLKTVNSSNNYKMDGSGSGDERYYDAVYKLSGAYYLGALSNDESYSSDKAAEEAEIILQPNEEMGILIFHEWLSSYTGEGVTMPSEGVKMNYNITLGFEQVTVQ